MDNKKAAVYFVVKIALCGLFYTVRSKRGYDTQGGPYSNRGDAERFCEALNRGLLNKG